MSRVVYSRNKDGSNVYHCAGYRKDGEPCGHRVQSYGSLCWQHKRAAAERRAAARAEDKP